VKEVTTGTTYLTLVIFGTICTFQAWIIPAANNNITTRIEFLEWIRALDTDMAR
jgi:hypothetical protein